MFLARQRSLRFARLALLLLTTCFVHALHAQQAVLPVAAEPTGFTFRDLAAERGLFPALAGIQGHAAGWGDVDGDGWEDLYVATFHKTGTKPNQLFFNRQGKLVLDEREEPRISTRATGSLLVDLDNDGDLDLYVSSMPQVKTGLRGCALFRGDGKGTFTDISEASGACPAEFGGRSATTLDFDGDGLLDLLVGEEPLAGGYSGSPTRSSRLLRNLGEMKFADVTQEVGIPAGIPGLGVAAADVSGDTWPDLFIAAQQGGNVLFLNDTKGKFVEAPGSRATFAWPEAKGDNMVCGVSMVDLNRDGLVDIVLGPHFDSPWTKPVGIRLYLNRGINDGVPKFEEVSTAAGLVALPMKAPHVELQDFNNDGWIDLYASMVKFADNKAFPMIFEHRGVKDGIPQFTEQTLAVNDFPTDADRAKKGAGAFFPHMLAEKKIFYAAPGPTADFDHDGRLDMFLASWWPEAPSLLLKNETKCGNWLQVTLQGRDGVNRMGIGARVEVYAAGKLDQPDALLAMREMAVGFGYASAQPAVVHVGLGAAERVDLKIVWPHQRGTVVRRAIAVNERVAIAAEAAQPE
ncbi:hypothetical protein Psta_1247 [Pirellula staleyi DSM 6068]|uniref:ASPIC/UnbV domain-containing protein n=1 Tax=Pirellula staleyi (strain ATCC 27377 / DSM 6068 / ICPB 4128) TaxID=530564 RepID=D2QW50_PIRSD|nr:CRTAC1 family protein [Pirellula staleyi]ADB15925.1 hypothetical protein Psta_1247 [Pirellula staleyi DSM 6068]